MIAAVNETTALTTTADSRTIEDKTIEEDGGLLEAALRQASTQLLRPPSPPPLSLQACNLHANITDHG